MTTGTTTTGVMVYTYPVCDLPCSGQTTLITPLFLKGPERPNILLNTAPLATTAKHPGLQATSLCHLSIPPSWQFANQLFLNFSGNTNNYKKLKSNYPPACTMQLEKFSYGGGISSKTLQFQTMYIKFISYVAEQADWGKTKEIIPELASVTSALLKKMN